MSCLVLFLFANFLLGSTCLCRPLYQVPAESNGSSQSTPSAPHKVQKSTKRQSTLRTDPENVAKALNIPNGNDHDKELTDSKPYIQYGPAEVQNASTPPSGAADSSNGASCCSKKERPDLSDSAGSCCDNINQRNAILNGSLCQPVFPPGQFSPWAFNNYSYPNFMMQHQPPSYTNGASLSQQVPLGFTAELQNGAHSSGCSHHAPTSVDDSHDCSCGDGCQCLGCVLHPYNDRTKQYVHDMGAMVAADEKDDEARPSALYQKTSDLPKTDVAPSVLDYSFSNNMETDGRSSLGGYPNDTLAGRIPSTSPEYSSTGLAMEPDEYYTIEYPVGLSSACSNVTGSCQCGNDCCCTGCLTHSGHNGLSITDPLLDPLAASSSARVDRGSRNSPSDKLMASFTVESPRLTPPQMA